MTVQQYILINASNVVENVVQWDGVATFPAPAGQSAVQYSGVVYIGGTWNGSTVSNPSPPPSPTNRQLADAALGGKIAAGIAITCTGNSALTGTYALDQNTLNQISGLVNNGFPHGNTTQAYPFQGGPPTSAFTVAQMTALRNDMRDYVFDLETQAGIMANGGSPSWPSNAFTIA